MSRDLCAPPCAPDIDDWLTMTALSERGWTPAMVRTLLGTPDRTRPNPHYRRAAPMRLWALARVAAAEASPGFAARQAKAAARSAASSASAARKKHDLAERISAVEVRVPLLDRDELVWQACESYNSRSRGDLRATPDSDPEFLDRICVNYLRHELTGYEAELDALYGQVGRKEARDIIRAKVYDAIADAYPDLAAECSRQAFARRDLALPGYAVLDGKREETMDIKRIAAIFLFVSLIAEAYH